MTRAVAFATVILALLALGDRLDPVREGLAGTYYANSAWTDPPSLTTRDSELSNQQLDAAWHGSPPPQFSVAWTGWLLAMREGPYALATISDDGSSVFVDGQLVVDNGGARDWPRGVTGSVTLTRGVHAIHVRFARE